jgi:hypothetical protein
MSLQSVGDLHSQDKYCGRKITELRKRRSKRGSKMERARGERDGQESEHV